MNRRLRVIVWCVVVVFAVLALALPGVHRHPRPVLMTTVLDIVRAVNVPLSLAAFLMLAIRVNDTWPGLRRGDRLTRVGILLGLFCGALGSAVKYVVGAPVDPSICLWSAACLLVVVGQWVTRPHRRPRLHP